MTEMQNSKDYKEIRKLCEKSSRISERVIDDFLLYFAARHHGLEKKMKQAFSRYKHVGAKFGKEAINLFKSQYIIHQVFKEGGLIEKFLKNPALDRFSGEDRNYLEIPSQVPWRFSYAVIIEEPEEDFFLMEDVFTGDSYLLFSPGMSDIKTSGRIQLWFNLVGFNGACWQSFGPIGAFQSFGAEDIYFFSSEKNQDIENESEVQDDIEKDPIPYMMLISGAEIPRTFNGEDEMILQMAEHDIDILDTTSLREEFKSEFDSGVYRLTHKEYGEPPHFAQMYFDEEEKIILFSAMTDIGFRKMIQAFNNFGHNFPDLPFLRVRMQMLATAGNILKKKIVLNEYESMFPEKRDPAAEKAVEDMNAFMALVLPDINAGRTPDIEGAAKRTGVHIESARDMVDMIMGKLNALPDMGEGLAPDLNQSNEQGKKIVVRDTESESYEEIYTKARAIREMEPWNSLYETDFFGVKMPGCDRIYFISVMGSGGEYNALAIYIGYKGLFKFSELQKNIDRLPEWTILTIPHLLLSFTDREEMDKENMVAIKKSGINFRGKGMWPKLEEVVPGYAPVFPEKQTLDDLPVLLDQAASVLSFARENPDLLVREGATGPEILIRTPDETQDSLYWKNIYEHVDPENGKELFKMTYKLDGCKELSKLKVEQVVLQVDLVLLPAPVKVKGKKGYFPFMLILVDKETGMVSGMKILAPEPDLSSLYESVPQKLMEEITELGFRPEKIEFRSDLLFNLTKKALRESYCMSDMVDHLPLVDEAIDSLISSFQ